jgi:hypothetical protein
MLNNVKPSPKEQSSTGWQRTFSTVIVAELLAVSSSLTRFVETVIS